MRPTLAAIGATAVIIIAAFAAPEAQAHIFAPGLAAPNHVEQVACRTVTSRVVRPNGRVVVSTRRVCSPGPVVVGPRCRMVRERVVRPNGAVVFRSIRRC